MATAQSPNVDAYYFTVMIRPYVTVNLVMIYGRMFIVLLNSDITEPNTAMSIATYIMYTHTSVSTYNVPTSICLSTFSSIPKCSILVGECELDIHGV